MGKLNTYPLVSVVIPCRNHADELRHCLRGLECQTTAASHEIIVVDSAADPAVAEVASGASSVRLVRSRSGLLPGGARNLGARYALGHYLAFIDADCIPEPKWLEAATTALAEGHLVVGGPVLDANLRHPISIVENLLQFVNFSTNRPDGPSSYLPGCNLAVSRSTFDKLGGFHETLPAGEDIILSNAASNLWPRKVRFVNHMRVRHSGRTKIQPFLRRQEEFGYYRGRLGLLLLPTYQSLGRLGILTVPVILKRLAYIVLHASRWNPATLPRILILLPILLLGLGAWAKGFYHGCQEAGSKTNGAELPRRMADGKEELSLSDSAENGGVVKNGS